MNFHQTKNYLKNVLNLDEDTANSHAAIILGFEDEQRWINVEDELPVVQSISKPSAKYYSVWTEKYGIQSAMYLTDLDGNNGWYLSYIAKLIVPVIKWGVVK